MSNTPYQDPDEMEYTDGNAGEPERMTAHRSSMSDIPPETLSRDELDARQDAISETRRSAGPALTDEDEPSYSISDQAETEVEEPPSTE